MTTLAVCGRRKQAQRRLFQDAPSLSQVDKLFVLAADAVLLNATKVADIAPVQPDRVAPVLVDAPKAIRLRRTKSRRHRRSRSSSAESSYTASSSASDSDSDNSANTRRRIQPMLAAVSSAYSALLHVLMLSSESGAQEQCTL